MKIIIVLSCLFASSQTVFAADAKIANERNTVDKSCMNEGQVARCGNDVVGKVLFDCIDKYKADKGDAFKISSACQTAIDKLKADKKMAK